MSAKNWATLTVAATTATQVSFAKNVGAGLITDAVADSWMPFSWLAFLSSATALIDVRVYLRGCPTWADDSVVFGDDYTDQFLAVQLPIAAAGAGPVVFRGEIWGFAVIDTPTQGLLIAGGTGACPYS